MFYTSSRGHVAGFNEQQVISPTGVYKTEAEGLQAMYIWAAQHKLQEDTKLCTLAELLKALKTQQETSKK